MSPYIRPARSINITSRKFLIFYHLFNILRPNILLKGDRIRNFLARSEAMRCGEFDRSRITRAHTLLLGLGRHLGIFAAYHAFERAAELEDRCERLRAASWNALGSVIIVALSVPSGATIERREIFESDSHVEQNTSYIAHQISVLIEAGRKGGSISAESVLEVAQNLGRAISALNDEFNTR